MDWHPSKIKELLWERGTSLEKLALQHNYRRIDKVLYRNWVAAETIVADAIGCKPQEIWPSRYKTSRLRGKLMTRNKTVLRRHKSLRVPKSGGET
jgi:Ner family transcriptional regulator